ncbi:solute carrier family 35 member G1-like [Tigriopus californicus]|uniref:solute carrier family 35 member G1-like n=1 Tax=Tigriopus californicus TaxID=6832 RepID=UPI0027D9E458|nr:solute carrier family 35 member G1-like [Tigriopus californicus]
MILGVLLACASVCSYTIFGIVAQYYGLNPIDLILGRSCIQSLVVSVVMIMKRDSLELSKSTILVGCLFFVSTSGFIFVIYILPLGTAFILTHSTAGFTAIFARLLAKENITLLKAVCIVSILLGQFLVIEPSFLFTKSLSSVSLGSMEYIGIAIGFFCSISTGLLTVMVTLNKTPKQHMFLIGSLLSLFLALVIGPLVQESQIFHGSSSKVIWKALIQSLFVGSFALMSIGAFSLAIGLCPSVLLTLIATGECITSFVAQVVIFKQVITWIQVCGVVIVVLSLITAILIDDQNIQKADGNLELAPILASQNELKK